MPTIFRIVTTFSSAGFAEGPVAPPGPHGQVGGYRASRGWPGWPGHRRFGEWVSMRGAARVAPTATFMGNRLRLGHPGKLMVLGLHCFYIKQAAPRPFEQAHGARLALLLRLQRADRLMVVYLGRCPRLRTVALSARVGHTGRGQAAMGVFRIGHDGCGRCPGLYTGCTASARDLYGHGSHRHG